METTGVDEEGYIICPRCKKIDVVAVIVTPEDLVKLKEPTLLLLRDALAEIIERQACQKTKKDTTENHHK